jgi:hypothetical protein
MLLLLKKHQANLSDKFHFIKARKIKQTQRIHTNQLYINVFPKSTICIGYVATKLKMDCFERSAKLKEDYAQHFNP